MGDLHFLYTLKWLHEFHNYYNTHKNLAFSSGILFSIASALFQYFLSNQTHIAKIPFWFLETQGSSIDSIYELLLLSRAPQDSIDTAVSLSRLFLLLLYKNCRNKLWQERNFFKNIENVESIQYFYVFFFVFFSSLQLRRKFLATKKKNN